jgi:hypothetical protein
MITRSFAALSCCGHSVPSKNSSTKNGPVHIRTIHTEQTTYGTNNQKLSLHPTAPRGWFFIDEKMTHDTLASEIPMNLGHYVWFIVGFFGTMAVFIVLKIFGFISGATFVTLAVTLNIIAISFALIFIVLAWWFNRRKSR